jgi:hypothetical protein
VRHVLSDQFHPGHEGAQPCGSLRKVSKRIGPALDPEGVTAGLVKHAIVDQLIDRLDHLQSGIQLDEGLGPEEALIELALHHLAGALVANGQEAPDKVAIPIDQAVSQNEDVHWESVVIACSFWVVRFPRVVLVLIPASQTCPRDGSGCMVDLRLAKAAPGAVGHIQHFRRVAI